MIRTNELGSEPKAPEPDRIILTFAPPVIESLGNVLGRLNGDKRLGSQLPEILKILQENQRQLEALIGMLEKHAH